MRTRPDLLDESSPDGLEVVQLTHEEGMPGGHIYMEAQIFTPDSRRLILQRSGFAHGSDRKDPNHQFLLCDLDDRCRLAPLTHEIGATSPSISPDGMLVYYFVDETSPAGGKLTLKSVKIDGTERRTLMVVDRPLPAMPGYLSEIYPLSTISSDGQRLATAAFLGDGRTENAPFGLLVFDLHRATVKVILTGSTWCNLHPQYCRSQDATAVHDILIQENHGCAYSPRGDITTLVSGLGADIHVIRDDGTGLRDLPFGRDVHEACQGHQCWRGDGTWVISSTMVDAPSQQQLVEGRAAPHIGHVGLNTPGAVRNVISRSITEQHFWHFGTDRAGKRLVSDAGSFGVDQAIYVAELQGVGEAAVSWRYLLTPHSHSELGVHLHPFLSPDGRCAFFNSDESGLPQAYMLAGLPDMVR
ncbi:MAG: TolB family protein [Anaerolineae bacterium]